MPALEFGIVATVAPFLVMQRSFGLNIAASKTPDPNQVRLKSLITHIVFGASLYTWAFLLKQLRFPP